MFFHPISTGKEFLEWGILALSSDVIWSQKALLFLKIQGVRNEDENYADAGNENSAILNVFTFSLKMRLNSTIKLIIILIINIYFLKKNNYVFISDKALLF